MIEVIIDVETQKAFTEAGGYEPKKLGVSFVGICRRSVDDFGKAEGRLFGFFEKDLHKLWPILEQAGRIVGFNVLGFDLPVLSAYYSGDFSGFPVLDILEEVKRVTQHRVSLNALAKETLDVQKSGTGLDALAFYEQGKFKELEEYCLSDVRITRDLYDFGKEHKQLKFKDKWNRVITVPVNFSFKEEARVQMSLGV